MLKSARFYNKQRKGLGAKLLTDVDAAIVDIVLDPERWPEQSPGVRKCLTKRFRFLIYYSMESSAILVHAIVHPSRKPGYWLGRIGF